MDRFFSIEWMRRFNLSSPDSPKAAKDQRIQELKEKGERLMRENTELRKELDVCRRQEEEENKVQEEEENKVLEEMREALENEALENEDRCLLGIVSDLKMMWMEVTESGEPDAGNPKQCREEKTQDETSPRSHQTESEEEAERVTGTDAYDWSKIQILHRCKQKDQQRLQENFPESERKEELQKIEALPGAHGYQENFWNRRSDYDRPPRHRTGYLGSNVKDVQNARKTCKTKRQPKCKHRFKS